MAVTVASQYKRLKDLLDGFAQLFGYVCRGQIVLIDRVGNQLVADAGTVQEAGSVGLLYLFGHYSSVFFGRKICSEPHATR